MEFLSKHSEYLTSLDGITLAENDNEKLRHIVMSLEGLKNIIKNNPDVEIQCIGHFKLLFQLLSCNNNNNNNFKAIQKGALEVIINVTKNQECVNDIAANDVVVHLLLCLNTLKDSQLQILEALYALMSTTKIVKDALNKGNLIFIIVSYNL